MQNRKPFVQKINFKKFRKHFLGEMALPQTAFFSISNFWLKLTQPNVHRKKFAKSLFPMYEINHIGKYGLSIYQIRTVYRMIDDGVKILLCYPKQ